MPALGGPQNEYEQTLFRLGPFGGLDLTTAPYYVSDANFIDGENFTPNQNYGGLTTTLGRVEGFSGLLPSDPRGSTKMVRTGQPDLYLWAVDHLGAGEIWYAPFGGVPAPLALPTPLTAGKTTYFASVGQWIFVTNGVDTPIKIDTSLNVTLWGIVAPITAPTPATGGAGNLFGSYHYCVTFGNSLTGQESSQGVISGPIPAANQSVNLAGIPTSTDTQVNVRYLYRVGGALGTWQRVGTLNDNTTTTFNDNTGDASVTGVFLVPRREPPPPFTVICEHQQRIFGFGTPTDASQVWWSNFNEPWGFDSVNNVQEAGENSGGDYAVGILSTGSVLLMLKSRNPYAIYGQTDADFRASLQKLADNIGCISGKSAVVVDGVAYWLGNQGVWTWGGSFGQISDGAFAQSNIKDALTAMTVNEKNAAVGFAYDHMYHISFPLTVDKTYFWEAKSRQWYRLGYSTPSAYFNPEDTYQVIAANRTTTGEVDAWFQSGTDLGQPIVTYLVSKVSDSDALEATKVYRHLILQAPGQLGASATVGLTVNPGINQYSWSWPFNLGNPANDDTGTRHIVSPPMTMMGFECQLSVTLITTQQTIVERVAVTGWINRRLIQKG